MPSNNSGFLLVQNTSLLFLRVLSLEAAQYIHFTDSDHLNDK